MVLESLGMDEIGYTADEIKALRNKHIVCK